MVNGARRDRLHHLWPPIRLLSSEMRPLVEPQVTRWRFYVFTRNKSLAVPRLHSVSGTSSAAIYRGARRFLQPECRAQNVKHHSPPAMGETELAAVFPFWCAEWSSRRRELSRRCLSLRGRFRLRPVDEGTGASWRCGRGAFFIQANCLPGARPHHRQPAPQDRTKAPSDESSQPTGRRSPVPLPQARTRLVEITRQPSAAAPKSARFIRKRTAKGGRFAGRDPANHRQLKAPRSKQQGAPGLRRGDESCQCRPKRRPDNPPAMAKPMAVGRRTLGIVASMSEPAVASFDATPPDAGSREPVRQGPLPLLCGFAGGETRPITASRKHSKTKRPALGPCRGDESPAAPETRRWTLGDDKLWPGTVPQLAAMAKPSRQQLPFCSAERSLRPARGIVASMSEPQGDGTAEAGWARELATNRRCGRGRYIHLCLPQERTCPPGRETWPITNRRQPQDRSSKDQNLDRPAPGRRIGPITVPETKAPQPNGNGEAEPAAAFPSAAPVSPRPGIVASMSEPVRASSTRPAGGWSEGTGASRRCGRALLCLLCRHKKGGRPPGETANHRRPKATREPNSKDQGPGPWPAPGDESSGMPCPNWPRHDSPPAMAKPSRQQPSLLQRPARGRRKLSRRCLEPARASFDATRQAVGGAGNRREPALRQGRFLWLDFRRERRRRHKKVAPPGRDPPITANRRHPKIEAARIKAWTPACAGATNRSRECRALKQKAPQPAGNGEAEPAAAFPFCSAEEPAAGGIVASMSEPARASFDATRRTRVERGHRREPALRQGLLW